MLGIDELFLIGPIGSTKTFAMAMTHINIAQHLTTASYLLAVRDLSEAQIGTWEVYLILSKMNYRHGTHYTTRQAMNDLRIRFNKTGSIIQFIGMNRSRDPDWQNSKSPQRVLALMRWTTLTRLGTNSRSPEQGGVTIPGAPRHHH